MADDDDGAAGLMVTVVVVRRFKVAPTSPPTCVEAVKVLDLPICPRQSDVIVFDGDGTRAGVAEVWLTAESCGRGSCSSAARWTTCSPDLSEGDASVRGMATSNGEGRCVSCGFLAKRVAPQGGVQRVPGFVEVYPEERDEPARAR